MRFFFLLLIIAFSHTFLHAQQIRGGIIAGVSPSQVSGDRLSGFNKVGLTGGLLAKTAISPKMDVEVELLFVQKGSRKPIDPDNNDYEEYKLELNYIEVPLIFQYHFNEKWIFDAGISYGRLIMSRESDEHGEFPETFPFKQNEFSINGGINYYLFRNVLMNWRISNSVLPVRPHVSGAQFRLNRGQYNTVLMFLLKYEFGSRTRSENNGSN
ncbi:MAG: porin family protein [Bacteroidia bacterium]